MESHVGQTNASRRIRTLVAENSPAPGEVINTLVRMDDYIEIVGKVTDGPEAIEAVSVLKPDLLLIDARLPHIDGVTVSGVVAQQHPGLCVVLMFEQQSRQLRSQTIPCSYFTVRKSQFLLDFCGVLTKMMERNMESVLQGELGVEDPL